jgi:scyllo-inositol 2-dehydrogenase (NAD+)
MGRRHAENLRHLVPGAHLVAVADAVEDRARKVAAELEIEKSFGSLEAMLECKGVDAVVIATPDAFHAPAVILTAAAGKPMLCEKPLALNLADASNALAAVAKHRVYFQVGFMRRYDSAYSLAMKRIEAGEIGSPLIFKSLGRDKEGPPLSYYHSQVNGMLFYTNTIHDFDLARWMVQDEVTEVHAFTTSVVRPEVTQFGDVVASVVNLKFAKGAIGNIESHAQAQYGYDVRTEVVGSKGSLQVGSLHRTPTTFLTTSGSVSPIADYFLSTFADAYLAEVRDFVDRILNDRPPSVTGEDGFKALAMAAAAEQSHAQSRVTRVEA